MSISQTVVRGGSWLALFNATAQIFSWSATLFIARILSPFDYGLVELAAIFTGYAELFSDLGLGSAIIQRQDLTHKELSSVFWFSFGLTILVAASCFPLSYVTSFVFHEPRVIPLTQTISLVIVLNGLLIVPVSLLNRNLKFAAIGRIELMSVVIGCSFMLAAAHMGAGAWTLILGLAVRSLAKVILTYLHLKWLPAFHLSFNEAKACLKFGCSVAAGRSLWYLFNRSDKFFAGRVWPTQILGYYSFALNLAQLPTEKITVFINQISFPVLSRLQTNKEEFKIFYLKSLKITAALVLPLFVGAFLAAEELIHLFLGEKWVPIIFVFKFLCLTQITTSLTAINGFVHNAQGRPHWSMIYYAACAVLMSGSFYFAVPYGLNAVLIPWYTTYVLLSTGWIYVTIIKIEVSLREYFRNILGPLAGIMVMCTLIAISKHLFLGQSPGTKNLLLLLGCKLLLGGSSYFFCLWLLDRTAIRDLIERFKTREEIAVVD